MTKDFLRNNFLVLALYLVLLLMSLSLILRYDKVIIHIYLNQYVGNSFLDQLFYYITYLGDGLTAPFILLLILVYNVRAGIYTLSSFLSATLVSQVLKRCFFDDVNRPSYIFQWIHPYPIQYVEGVDRYILNSFPSGHATQAFSILMCLVFLTRNTYMKLLFFFLALGTAASRVYLSQHWLEDVTVGSAIGLGFSLLFYYLFIGKNKLAGLNKPLLALKNRNGVLKK